MRGERKIATAGQDRNLVALPSVSLRWIPPITKWNHDLFIRATLSEITIYVAIHWPCPAFTRSVRFVCGWRQQTVRLKKAGTDIARIMPHSIVVLCVIHADRMGASKRTAKIRYHFCGIVIWNRLRCGVPVSRKVDSSDVE